MPNIPHYACTRCGKDCKRELLTVKKAMFVSMGEGSDTKRSRVIAWLCPACLDADPHYLLEPNSRPAVANAS